MDFIVVRHRRSNEPPPANREIFVDATLVVNAETNADALRAVGDQIPNDAVKSWDVLPVRKIDAT